MANRFSWMLAKELNDMQPGEAVVVDWSNASTRGGLKATARRAAARAGLVVALDPVFDGLKVTVVDHAGKTGQLLA